MSSDQPRNQTNGKLTPARAQALGHAVKLNPARHPGTGNDFRLAPAPHANGHTQRPRVLFVTDFYLEEMLGGVADYAHRAGWELNSNMRFHGLFPHETKADGILATITREAKVRDWLANWNCPIVQVLKPAFDLPHPAVELDYTAAGRAGARHLLELGHVHYAFYWISGGSDTLEVRNGFEAELAQAGRRAYRLDTEAAHPGQEVRKLGREARCRWVAAELKRLPRPLAVMGDDDRRGLELLDACALAGLRVPEDVAVLGCDNHVIEQKLAPLSLSSVDVNLEGLGWEAASLLERLMRGESVPADVIKVPPQGVVARQSTATFVTDSLGITAAVLHLREHFPEPLRIAELARLAGLSKRAFETEFKRRVGRPPREEIQRVRLGCAARLLRDTDLKLSAIAVESGLGSASQLCRAFFEAHGVSPNVWRERVRNSL